MSCYLSCGNPWLISPLESITGRIEIGSRKETVTTEDTVAVCRLRLYWMYYTNCGLVRLSRNAATDVFPHWSPNGERIIFSDLPPRLKSA
jgi:hypothetical protein